MQVPSPNQRCFPQQDTRYLDKVNPRRKVFRRSPFECHCTHLHGKDLASHSSVALWQKKNKKSTQIFDHSSLTTFCRTPFVLYSLRHHITHQRMKGIAFHGNNAQLLGAYRILQTRQGRAAPSAAHFLSTCSLVRCTEMNKALCLPFRSMGFREGKKSINKWLQYMR